MSINHLFIFPEKVNISVTDSSLSAKWNRNLSNSLSRVCECDRQTTERQNTLQRNAISGIACAAKKNFKNAKFILNHTAHRVALISVFRSPQPGTSLHCKTTDRMLVPAYVPAHCTYPQRNVQAELAWVQKAILP